MPQPTKQRRSSGVVYLCRNRHLQTALTHTFKKADCRCGRHIQRFNFTRHRDQHLIARDSLQALTYASALITDMNQVLGHSCGNALEVWEALEFLSGTRRDPRLLEVTSALCAELLVLGGLAPDTQQARTRIDRVLADGSAQEHFARMVAALGGPADFVQHPQKYLAAAPVQRAVLATCGGWVTQHATRDIGLLVIELGGGRRMASDAVDHRVGMRDVVPVGQRVEAGDRIAVVHAVDAQAAEGAAMRLGACIQVADRPPAAPPAPLLIRVAPLP